MLINHYNVLLIILSQIHTNKNVHFEESIVLCVCVCGGGGGGGGGGGVGVVFIILFQTASDSAIGKVAHIIEAPNSYFSNARIWFTIRYGYPDVQICLFQ